MTYLYFSLIDFSQKAKGQSVPKLQELLPMDLLCSTEKVIEQLRFDIGSKRKKEFDAH